MLHLHFMQLEQERSKRKITKIRNRNWLLGETIKGKGKSKLAYAPKPKIPPPPKKDNPAKDAICHQCGDVVKSFLDHLKEHGIIAHRTPPYMSQHNGMSERRNRTRLDMVCSMMSQTTLPKSFWDYALDFVARILNMVPTKKVEKTPYEDLVDLPPNGKTIGSKWIFKKTTDMDEVVHTYNARLVAKGFTQTYGVDYEETFSPVADISAIRILIAITAFYDYEIWQMDVKTTFLNGHPSEEVYMVQPEGEAAYIFGIKIYRDRSRRLIGPSTPTEVKRMHNIPYASVVGPIMYAIRCTRPDVAFAQNITSRFQQNPGDIYWTALRVSCYTDAGYVTDAYDLKSQTRYVFVLNGGAVDRKSTKLSIFATSSVEAEYIAAYDASKEAVWIRKFIYGLGVVPTIEEPIKMYCDNTVEITIANESGITKGARHYRAKVHCVREVIELGDIKLEKVHTDDNLADLFTKALPFLKHSEHTKNIRMLPASSFM
ncbi:retrotransposon protein, putative, ty1-copia subclass [Tanacetum coccineum]